MKHYKQIMVKGSPMLVHKEYEMPVWLFVVLFVAGVLLTTYGADIR